MTIGLHDLLLYSGALLILFMTPGPVWVALTARAMSGGFNAAWPLAMGVVIGDMLWPFLAILGVTWIVTVFAGFLAFLKWVACLTFLVMGIMILRHADASIATDSRLTRPGMWSGFLAGLAVIIGNPKAILFYMGMLPGFFDLSTLQVPDMVAISLISGVIPLCGNLLIGMFIGKARAFLGSPKALRRTNITAGILLVCVGAIIPFL